MRIDWWTLGIQTVNVAVLVWLLQHFFWRPVSAMIATRAADAKRVIADAQAKSTQAKDELASVEKTRAGMAAERQAMLTAATEAADRIAKDSLAKTAEQAAATEAAATAAIARERTDDGKAWADRSSRLAVDIAGRLAARLDGREVDATFLGWLLAALRALPEATRSAASAEGSTLVATTAAPIAAADQERYRGQIDEALGGHPAITFEVDPALIGGIELRGPHLTVTNSWRADLGRILADLTHA